MRYLWEICPTNKNFAEMHMDKRLPNHREGDYSFLNRDPIPAEFKPFFDGVMAIPGVESATTNNHVIGIIKGTVFRWDEIMPTVERLARDTFDPDGSLDGGRGGPEYGLVASMMVPDDEDED